MKLIKLWEADPIKAYQLQCSFEKDENGFMNAAYGLSYEEFLLYVETKRKNAHGIDLPDGHVPSTVFILEDQDNYVGIFNFRHYLNDFLKNNAGHVGYGIRKDYRKKGYATQGLALLIETIKPLIIEDEIYISVNKNNIHSLRVQLNNNAYIHHEDKHHYYTRIKLD